MPNDLPATLPVRLDKELPAVRAETGSIGDQLQTRAPFVTPALAAMTVRRADLATVVRFAARLANRAPMPALQSCLFLPDAVVVTDLDLALRAHLPGARDIGVLVPIPVLKRSVSVRQSSDMCVEAAQNIVGRSFSVSIDGAVFSGRDPREFPDVAALFPSGEPIARACMGSLEPVLVAASTDETRKSLCALFFQLCKNVVVGSNGHVLHTLEIQSKDEGDFLVPRKTAELVENVRKATKTTEVEVDFFEHQCVFRVDRFEISSRLEAERFPAWEEVLPKKPKYELRVSKRALLDALDQIAAAIGERSWGIVLHRVTDGLEIHGENPDAGAMKTVVEASGWEEGQTIGVNLAYLYNAAMFVPSEELRVGITDVDGPLTIDDGPYFACVMPMQLKGDDK